MSAPEDVKSEEKLNEGKITLWELLAQLHLKSLLAVISTLSGLLVAAVWGGYGFGSRDSGELDRYRALGASPEQLKGRIDDCRTSGGAPDGCGGHVFRVPITSAKNETRSTTCGGTTYYVTGERLPADAGHDFRIVIVALPVGSERKECVVRGDFGEAGAFLGSPCEFLQLISMDPSHPDDVKLNAIVTPL